MTPPPDLAGLIAYVRSRDRQHSIDGRLLAEIDRLRAENAELKADLDAACAWLRETFAPTKETPDV